MTTQTTQPLHRIGTKEAGIGLAAAALAAAVAYAVAVLALEDDTPGRTSIPGVGAGQVGAPWEQHAKPATFPGTDREWRVQLHGR